MPEGSDAASISLYWVLSRCLTRAERRVRERLCARPILTQDGVLNLQFGKGERLMLPHTPHCRNKMGALSCSQRSLKQQCLFSHRRTWTFVLCRSAIGCCGPLVRLWPLPWPVPRPLVGGMRREKKRSLCRCREQVRWRDSKSMRLRCQRTPHSLRRVATTPRISGRSFFPHTAHRSEIFLWRDRQRRRK